MKKTTLEKFSVSAIADQIGAVGVESARSALAFALGSLLDADGISENLTKPDILIRRNKDERSEKAVKHWT